MNQDPVPPKPTRPLITTPPVGEKPNQAGGLPTAGPISNNPSTSSATNSGTISPEPASRPIGWIAAVAVLAIGAGLAGTFGFLEKNKSAELSDLLTEEESAHTTLKRDNSTAVSNLESTKEDLERARTEALEIRSELDSKQSALDAAITERDSLRTSSTNDLARKDEEIRDKNTEIAQLSSEIEDLKQRLEDAGPVIEVPQEELAELREKNQKLKADLERERSRSTAQVGTESRPSPTTESSRTLGNSSSFQPVLTEQPVARQNIRRGPAYVRLGEFKTGRNKGKWYFVAPDGFSSPLYSSRDQAVLAAELRAGHPQANYPHASGQGSK